MEILKELFQRNAPLAWFGTSQFICVGIALLLMLFDHRKLNGINVWVKPIKFYISVGIFAWSIGWFLSYLPDNVPAHKFSIWFIYMFIAENGLITLQAARGIKSHFNQSNAVNGIIFSVMGLIITLSTVLTGYITYLFFVYPDILPPAFLWSVRLGLIVFTLASLEGFIMVRYQRHAIGGEDGDAGYPVLNWNRKAGDLRIAHAAGIHGMQIIPLFGYLINMYVGFTVTLPVFLFTAVYVLFCLYLLRQALRGKPLLPYRDPIVGNPSI